MSGNAPTPAVKKRAPMLYCIAVFKLIKGLALVLLALGVLSQANKDLPDVFDQFLRWVHLDPERKFFQAIGEKLGTITPTNVRAVALGLFIGGVYLIVLGSGLAFRAKWAIWLSIGESAFFIPIEIYELVRRRSSAPLQPPHQELFRHPQIGMFVVLALNVIIVWYLFENRKRLFRHHH